MPDAGLPPTYRLLAAFSGIPLKTFAALEAAGLRGAGDRSEISDHHRALLRQLANSGRIRWVAWGPHGSGYVLTGHGEHALDIYFRRYGPAHTPRRGAPLGDLARQNTTRDDLAGEEQA